MKKLAAGVFLALAGVSIGARAQQTFPVGTDLCEHDDWKLVFYDEFDGNSVDLSKWSTYEPGWQNGVLTGSVVGSRSYAGNQLWKDDNVEVSNGTCKLYAKEEPYSYTYMNGQNTITQNEDYTAGALYNYTNNFYRGKFVMRARLPKGYGVWPAFWLFDLHGGANEVDFFEYYGGTTPHDMTATIHRNDVSPTTHWHEGYHLDDPGDWHIYSSEWDENFIRHYVDGALKVTQHRYHSNTISDLSACYPDNVANYYDRSVNPIATVPIPFSATCFPDNNKGGVLIINNAVNVSGNPNSYEDALLNNLFPPHAFSSTMEVDYIRVYQRNPQEGLVDLCPHISGIQVFCDGATGEYTYTLLGDKVTNLRWTVDGNGRIITVGNSSVSVRFPGPGNYGIRATYENMIPGCENTTSYLPVVVGAPPTPSVSTSVTGPTAGHYSTHLIITNPANNTDYVWHVWETSSTPSTKTGASVYATSNYTPISWNVTGKNECGSASNHFYGEGGPQIEERLAPESSGTNSVFPNPVGTELKVMLDGEFSEGKDISVRVLDVTGKVYVPNRQDKNGRTVTADVSNLAKGNYLLEISNGSSMKIIKFEKG